MQKVLSHTPYGPFAAATRCCMRDRTRHSNPQAIQPLGWPSGTSSRALSEKVRGRQQGLVSRAQERQELRSRTKMLGSLVTRPTLLWAFGSATTTAVTPGMLRAGI